MQMSLPLCYRQYWLGHPFPNFAFVLHDVGIQRQPVLAGVPVLANIDVGHTNPLATLPIGGQVQIHSEDRPHLRITRSSNCRRLS